MDGSSVGAGDAAEPAAHRSSVLCPARQGDRLTCGRMAVMTDNPQPGTWRIKFPANADAIRVGAQTLSNELVVKDVYPSTDADLPGCVVLRDQRVSPSVVAVIPSGAILYMERVGPAS